MVFADLHMHSTASDGVLSPAQILARASEAGLRALAITDHDTCAGTKMALDLAAQFNLIVVPGVEMTTQVEGRNVHMLGYFFDVDSVELATFFAENRRRREQRACAMADNLAADGFPVSSDMVRSSGKTINRSLLARMLVQSGCAANIDDAFRRFIGQHSPYYVECSYPESAEAVHLIRAAGGYAFIAHPAHYRVVDLIEPLVHEGMTGVEAFHTMQSKRQSALLVDLAHSLGAGISGGSDWHGDGTHGAQLGSAGLSEAEFTAFLSACGQKTS